MTEKSPVPASVFTVRIVSCLLAGFLIAFAAFLLGLGVATPIALT